MILRVVNIFVFLIPFRLFDTIPPSADQCVSGATASWRTDVFSDSMRGINHGWVVASGIPIRFSWVAMGFEGSDLMHLVDPRLLMYANHP